jgi:hypothetical protein
MSAQPVYVDDDSRKDPWPPPPPPPEVAPPAGHAAGHWSSHTSAYVPAGSGDPDRMPAVTVFVDRKE